MQYFQGDVAIIPVANVPKNAQPVPRDNKRIVLAYGEVTGHAHAILDREAELYSVPDTEDRFLRIMAASGVELKHEEHATITLPQGNYIVRQQREYVAPEIERRVAD